MTDLPRATVQTGISKLNDSDMNNSFYVLHYL